MSFFQVPDKLWVQMSFTIANQEDSFFNRIKPFLIYVFLFIALGGITYAVSIGMQRMPSLRQNSNLTVKTWGEEAIVLIDGEEVGITPIEDMDIVELENITLQSVSDPTRTYSISMDPAPNTGALVYRDLGVSSLFSEGRDIWFEKGRTGMTVISQPSGATVYLDGTEMGMTPLSLDDVTEGEYELALYSPGYDSHDMRITTLSGHNLKVSVQLFPRPAPQNPKRFDDSENLWDLTISDETIAGSFERARATSYYYETRGVDFGIEEDMEDFDYYLDYMGNIFNSDGVLLTLEEAQEVIPETRRGGYLGVGAMGGGLTENARQTYLAIFDSKMATVLPTGTGWLRVRESPSLNASEISRVNEGETFSVLEELTGWVKIRISADQEGWVSSSYVRLSQ